MVEEMIVQLVLPVGSSEENGEKIAQICRRDGNVNSDTPVQVDDEKNELLEVKDEWKNLQFYQNEFLEVEIQENNKLLQTNGGGKDEALQSTDEAYETGSISEKDSDGKSVYKSMSGSDADDDCSSLSQRSQFRFSQGFNKPSDSQRRILQSSENEVAFGGSDWGEYWHEHAGELNSSALGWEATNEQDAESRQDDVQIGVDEASIELACLEGVRDVGYLSGDTSQIRGTGRPDLDDVEDDFEEKFVPGSLRSNFLDSSRNGGGGRPDLEENLFPDDGVTRNNMQRSLQGSSQDLSGISEGSFREDVDEFFLELHGHVDLGDQDELKSAFAKRSTERLEQSFRLEQEGLEEGENEGSEQFEFISDGAGFGEQVGESTTKMGFGVKMPSLDVQEAGVEIKSLLKLMADVNVQGSSVNESDFPWEAGQEDFLQMEPISETFGDGSMKKNCIIHGSKQTEGLLQTNLSRVEKLVNTPVEEDPKGSDVQDHRRAGVDWAAEDLGPDELSRYVEALEVKETYIDTVLDMEDILFDAEEGSGARLIQVGKISSPRAVRPIRDGSLNASTSSNSASVSRHSHWSMSTLTEIDWVEVVGASQRQGGASLGERVVGVKEYTVYRIKVKGRSKEWETHRRYRDFVSLYKQLQQLVAHRENTCLPPPWEKVKAESRKFFGNTSPDVVAVRSSLIQVCLQSLLQVGPPLSTAAPFLRFLFPAGEVGHTTTITASEKSVGGDQSGSQVLLDDFVGLQQYSPASNSLNSKDEQDRDDGPGISVFGKTIRLIVRIHKKKSLKQQLQAQHYACAGCYKHLELAFGLVPELVQNWGWSGPRLCEYSGQLFCSSCHLNETAVIPAWVLQRWDFTPRHVSQLAKAYLDSIYDKPMLCVSAVNPYLYVRVPVLAHLTEIRRKLSKMLGCIRCPARARIQSMLGSRRYLLENNDFFALRDLADLSKGAFAVLPEYMRTVLGKLSIHITRECSSCRELAEACAAKELCDDPDDSIYPYQDENITRCQACHLPYHKRCFQKCQKICSCKRKDQPDQILNSSFSTDVFYSQLSTESDLGTSLPAPVVLEREDSLASSSVSASDHKVKPRRSLLTNLLGPKEAHGSATPKEKRNPVVVNMSALLSRLDL